MSLTLLSARNGREADYPTAVHQVVFLAVLVFATSSFAISETVAESNVGNTEQRMAHALTQELKEPSDPGAEPTAAVRALIATDAIGSLESEATSETRLRKPRTAMRVCRKEKLIILIKLQTKTT